MTQSKPVVGDRVKVTTHRGGAFYPRSYDMEGVVTQVAAGSVHVRFDDGSTDFGRIDAVTVIKAFVKLGSRIRVVARFGGTFHSRFEGKEGVVTSIQDDTIYVTFDGTNETDYGAVSDVIVVDQTARLITNHADMREGMKVRLVSEGDRCHQHWGFKLNGVYECRNGAPICSDGQGADKNWAGWVWEVVEEAPVKTLDEQLAELKAELDEINAAKAVAQTELDAAQVKIDAQEAKRVELLKRLSKHGIQFIGEVVPVRTRTAQEAFEAGELEEGMTLLCTVPWDEDEHTSGKEYKINGRDEGDSHEFRLESDDGYGVWLDNDGLHGYNVV